MEGLTLLLGLLLFGLGLTSGLALMFAFILAARQEQPTGCLALLLLTAGLIFLLLTGLRWAWS